MIFFHPALPSAQQLKLLALKNHTNDNDENNVSHIYATTQNNEVFQFTKYDQTNGKLHF